MTNDHNPPASRAREEDRWNALERSLQARYAACSDVVPPSSILLSVLNAVAEVNRPPIERVGLNEVSGRVYNIVAEARARRERIATAALQGLLAGGWKNEPDLGYWSVKWADRLIAELDRKGGE